MQPPFISVICPVYNGEKFLPQALDSILAQQENEIECICIDDGSADSSLSILEKYQDKLALKIERKTNRNWVANTNYAISIAKGEYLCFLHQDDVWFPERLTHLKKLAMKHRETELFIHASAFINGAGNIVGSWNCPLPPYPAPIPSALLIERLLVQNFISISGVIFKREAALKTTGLDEALWYTADWDFWLQLASNTNAFYLPEPLSGFRIHSNSQTILGSMDTADLKNQLEMVLYKHIEKLDNLPTQKKAVLSVAEFSILVNVTLAQILHNERIDILKLPFRFLKLTPAQWLRYFRDSRLLERALPRIKENLFFRNKAHK